MAAGEDLDDVAERCAVERRHDPDFGRQRRQRPLARRVEEALGLELLLQLLERQLQRAEALGLEVVAEDLILALRLVDADPAARDHAQSVFGLELQVAHGRAVHHRLDLRAAILEREVQVAGVPQPAVGDLALDPEIAESGFEEPANRRRQLRDRDDAPFLRRGCLTIVLEGLREKIGHRIGSISATGARMRDRQPCEGAGVAAASVSTSAADRLRRSMAVARPVFGSAVTMTAFSRPGPVAASNLAGIAVDEPAERGVDGDADDRIVRPGHARVGQAGRALRQDPFVGGLHVRVRADHGRDEAIEVPAHGDLLRGRLGVEVHEDDARLGAERFDLAERERERIVERRHEHAPHQVQHADGFARPRAADDAAAAGHAGGEVGRPKQARLARQVLEHFLLVPDVVPRRHDVDAVAEDGVRHVAGDAEARRRVLDVGDDEVDPALLDQRRDRPPRDLPARLSKDVADEQNLHQSGFRVGRRLDGDRNLATAPLVDARQHDVQLAARKRGAGAAGVDRDLASDDAREMAERCAPPDETRLRDARSAARACGRRRRALPSVKVT